ncbi:MAG: NRDE family protein [Chitinophagaceae bacterium]|nr:NRDE family protein [Chitinophagaceae bacterium]
MCTVTFVPGREGVYHLTSNRDERISRSPAMYPRQYDGLTYPLDQEAGGSWVALKDSGDAGVLLNGAFVRHRRLEQYRKSRGLVFLEVVGKEDPLSAFDGMWLEGIEPFTLVLFTRGRLFECRWDGAYRHIRQLDTSRPHIWSSVTLYDEKTCEQREAWLTKWYGRGDISTASILAFHRQASRKGEVVTVSITTIRIEEGKGRLDYFDMKDEVRRVRSVFMIRLKHWEYWPFLIVYAPIFFYWIWLSLRARSLFFFSTANPTITNAGFLLESKRQIYDLLPEGSYPKTVYCRKGVFLGALMDRGLTYPVIAKPDIGQRGMGVELLKDECQLMRYAVRSKVDFLLQEYIDYPLEIGVFYYRVPGEPKGFISGIVGKEMLSVTGDGHSTVEELLCSNERYVLQLPLLRRTYGLSLQRVPGVGEATLLVPYGNHSRGAKFLDYSHRITPRLAAVIDDLCRQIPGFYFGRLDIKFNSWEELEAGEAFSIIELNGAGSEPTHIYDPRHSIFFAWREIKRHLDILYVVSRVNARRRGRTPMTFWQGVRMLWDYHKYEKLIAG